RPVTSPTPRGRQDRRPGPQLSQAPPAKGLEAFGNPFVLAAGSAIFGWQRLSCLRRRQSTLGSAPATVRPQRFWASPAIRRDRGLQPKASATAASTNGFKGPLGPLPPEALSFTRLPAAQQAGRACPPSRAGGCRGRPRRRSSRGAA